MRKAKHIVIAAAIAVSANGASLAQGVREGRYPATTGAISPPTVQAPPPWTANLARRATP